MPTDAAPGMRILSIDGGGMLGIMTTVYLAELERELGGDLRDHFDIIAGTSTGSILAAAVAMGLKADAIQELYWNRGSHIFKKSVLDFFGRTFTEGVSRPEYNEENLGEELQRQFTDGGEEVRFGDLKPLVMITAYETHCRQAKVFKNDRDKYKDLPVWELVKASSSAPTYFAPHPLTIPGDVEPGVCSREDKCLVDGGVFANNPSACAVAEALRINNQRPEEERFNTSDFVVASFGNGRHTRSLPYDSVKEWGKSEWIIPLISVMMDGDQDTATYIAKQIVGEQQFFRFDTRLDRGMDDMDNATKTNLSQLLSVARDYIRSRDNQQRIKDLAQKVRLAAWHD